jgi:hypothetical protein
VEDPNQPKQLPQLFHPNEPVWIAMRWSAPGALRLIDDPLGCGFWRRYAFLAKEFLGEPLDLLERPLPLFD